MREAIEELIATFNARVETDPQLQEEVEGMERTIQLVTEKEAHHMVLRDSRIQGLEEGKLEKADVTITTNEATFQGLVDGTVSPFKAMATGKLKLKASIEDALRLRKLISGRR